MWTPVWRTSLMTAISIVCFTTLTQADSLMGMKKFIPVRSMSDAQNHLLMKQIFGFEGCSARRYHLYSWEMHAWCLCGCSLGFFHTHYPENEIKVTSFGGFHFHHKQLDLNTNVISLIQLLFLCFIVKNCAFSLISNTATYRHSACIVMHLHYKFLIFCLVCSLQVTSFFFPVFLYVLISF